MMFKLFYIACILLIINSRLYGQTSTASVTASLVTPVGAEISGDINYADFFNKGLSTETPDAQIQGIEKGKHLSFLKIIGEVFSHHVTVETDIILKRKRENEVTLSARKPESLVSITVNFN